MTSDDDKEIRKLVEYIKRLDPNFRIVDTGEKLAVYDGTGVFYFDKPGATGCESKEQKQITSQAIVNWLSSLPKPD